MATEPGSAMREVRRNTRPARLRRVKRVVRATERDERGSGVRQIPCAWTRSCAIPVDDGDRLPVSVEGVPRDDVVVADRLDRRMYRPDPRTGLRQVVERRCGVMESTDQRAERRQNVVVPHESELAVDECDGLAALVIEAQSARSTVGSLRFQVTQQSLDRCRLPTWGSPNRIADPHDVSYRTAFQTRLVGHGSPLTTP